jgi:hypothetical protein
VGGLIVAFLLDDILLAPCKLLTAIGRTLVNHAVTAMTDDSSVRQQLLASQEQYELGRIGADEFCQQEEALMQQLDAIHRRKKSMNRV